MKWRKMTGLLMTGSIAAGMLFGCGGKDEGNTTDTKGEEVQELMKLWQRTIRRFRWNGR